MVVGIIVVAEAEIIIGVAAISPTPIPTLTTVSPGPEASLVLKEPSTLISLLENGPDAVTISNLVALHISVVNLQHVRGRMSSLPGLPSDGPTSSATLL